VTRYSIVFILHSSDRLKPQSSYSYDCAFILGETDWKIIAIDVKDPLADQLKGIFTILNCTK